MKYEREIKMIIVECEIEMISNENESPFKNENESPSN